MSGISTLTECEPPRREVGERDVGVHGPVVNDESNLQAGGGNIGGGNIGGGNIGGGNIGGGNIGGGNIGGGNIGGGNIGGGNIGGGNIVDSAQLPQASMERIRPSRRKRGRCWLVSA